MKPFLKWAGGKYSVIETLIANMPEGSRLIDVFAGAGSIFMNAGFERNIVCDVNDRLINTYRNVAEDVEGQIEIVKALFSKHETAKDKKAYYYEVREDFNSRELSRNGITVLQSAQFIFLNKHCFNGVYRENKKRQFNVPYGKPVRSVGVPEMEMRYFSAMAGECDFYVCTFQRSIAMAGEGDVVVCDPPYEPMPNRDGFTEYSGETWKFEQQKELVDCLLVAHGNGAKIQIMNSGAPNIRELYQDVGFKLIDLPTRRSVGRSGDSRVVANDVLGVME